MRKFILFAATIMMVTCVGCSKSAGDSVEAMQKYYANITDITAAVDVCADSGVIMDYSLAITKKGEQSAATVTAPQDISGITAVIQGSRAEISYDGAELEALLPPLAGYTPIDCSDGIFRSLANGIVANSCVEEKLEQSCLQVTFEENSKEDKCTKMVWVSAQTHAPVFAELYLNGDRILSVTFTSFVAN